MWKQEKSRVDSHADKPRTVMTDGTVNTLSGAVTQTDYIDIFKNNWHVRLQRRLAISWTKNKCQNIARPELYHEAKC